MKNLFILFAVMSFMFHACTPGAESTTQEKVSDEANPLLEEFNLPFGAPPFDKIRNEHFLPAIKAGIAAHKEEIDAIVNKEEPPTFENTLVALDQSGRLLNRVNTVFSNLNSAHTNDEMQEIAKEISPLRTAHDNDINLNAELFARIKTVWENRDAENITGQDLRLLERKYKEFVRSGALLEEEQKSRLREINERLSMLSLQFGQNVLAETNAFTLEIDNEEDLAGLPQWLIDNAADVAANRGKEGSWVFTLQWPSAMPFFQNAENRELRKELWTAFVNKANNGNDNDNNEIIREIIALRIEKANMLGYENHAAYALENNMANSVERVNELLDQLWIPALEAASREAADLQAMIESEGHDFTLEPYDWRYYASRLKAERFDLDDEEVKPYFSTDNVRNGIFMVCEKLWGLTFREIDDLPVYQKDVRVFEVMEEDGSHIGILYEDLFARDSKRGGAWMTSFRKQYYDGDERKAPLIKITCNFPPPGANTPSLLTFDELTTFFHEFGHALHGLLSDVRSYELSGTSVARDFVELPSQLLENWATEPEVMKMYARHYKTGEVIPDELIAKLEASGTYGQGFATVEYLASTFLDMAFHTLEEPFEGSAMDFEKAAMKEIGLIDDIVPRHRSTYFSHVFSGGYSARYYSYIWSGVLDTDAYEAFAETGDFFHPEKAQLLREHIYSSGGTADPMELYVAFRGAEPTIEPLLRKRGLMPPKTVRK